MYGMSTGAYDRFMKKPSHVSSESAILARITELLLQKGISQKQLLAQIGLQKGSYTEWKANRSNSYLKYIDQIATFLGTSPTYLLRGDSESEEKAVETNYSSELFEIFQRISTEKKSRLIEFARSLENET